PRLCFEVRLFRELPPGRSEPRLTRDIEQTGGKFPQVALHRVSVLAQQQHFPGLVQGEDGHRAGVFHEFAGDDAAVAEVNVLGADVPHAPFVDPLAAGDGKAGTFIAEPGRRHRFRTGTSTSRVARWLSNAAPMSPTNRGWGRVRRDLSSGCVWVPTKIGWVSSSSSTNSTSSPSGEVPAILIPASSSRSR